MYKVPVCVLAAWDTESITQLHGTIYLGSDTAVHVLFCTRLDFFYRDALFRLVSGIPDMR